MIRKFTTFLLIYSCWFCLTSCDDDEASAPPKPSFTQDVSAILTGEEVTFTVDQVDADAIALLPYGSEESGRAGVLIPKASFVNGKATIKYSYSQVGEFQPVVVASNFTADGESIERTFSDPEDISVSSDDKSITAFTFPFANETEIDQDARTIAVEIPYESTEDTPVPLNRAALVAEFTASPFTTVTVGGTAQTSETTANNFTNPVVYRVTADDGSFQDYTVTVTQVAEETIETIKSFGAKSIDKSFENKDLQGYVDNTGDVIVLLTPHGTATEVFDSLRVNYELDGGFATLEYGTAGNVLEQDSLLNFVSSPTRVVRVVAQEESIVTPYDVKVAVAPKLELTFSALIPPVEGETSEFGIILTVLEGTDLDAVATTSAVTLNPGQTVVAMTADGAAFVSGGLVDFSGDPVEFTLTILDTNIGETYTVTYTASVVVVP
jgi:hypothetical protein